MLPHDSTIEIYLISEIKDGCYKGVKKKKKNFTGFIELATCFKP